MKPTIRFDPGDLLALNAPERGDAINEVLIVGDLVGRVNADGTYATKAQTLQEIRETSGECIQDSNWKSSLVGPFAIICRKLNTISVYCPPGSGGISYCSDNQTLLLSSQEVNLYKRKTIDSLDIHNITRHLVAAPALQSLPFATISRNVARIPGTVEARFVVTNQKVLLAHKGLVWPAALEPRTVDQATAAQQFFTALAGYMHLLRSDDRTISLLLSGGVDSAVLAFAAFDAELDLALMHRIEKGREHHDTKSASALSDTTRYKLHILDDSGISQAERERLIISDALKGFGQLGSLRSTYYRSMTRHEATGGFVLDGQNMDSLYAYRVTKRSLTFTSSLQNRRRVSTAKLLQERAHEVSDKETKLRTSDRFLRNLNFASADYNLWLRESLIEGLVDQVDASIGPTACNFVKLKLARFLVYGQNSIRMRKIRFLDSPLTHRSLVASEGMLPFLLMQFPVPFTDVLNPKGVFTEFVGLHLGHSWSSFQRQQVGVETTLPIREELVYRVYDQLWNSREISFLQSISPNHDAYIRDVRQALRSRREVNRFGIANACNLSAVVQSLG